MTDPGAGRGDSALEMRGISRRFGAVQALRSVDLRVAAGTVHALLGENGAGKSTLMRVAFGLVRPDAGSIRLFGHQRDAGHDVRSAVAAGLGMVHQQPSLVPTLTAAENLVLGGRGRLRPVEAERSIRRLANESGLHVDPTALAGSLSVVEQQRLEILKALSRGARLLVLDEPTAVLAPSEIDALLAWVRGFARGGGTVVLITHKLREALAVADAVTVLRRGAVVHSGDVAGASETDLARQMFADAQRAPPSSSGLPAARSAEPVVRANSITVRDHRGVVRVRGASFELRPGEIVGLAAIEGSGHRELMRALASQIAVSEGTLDAPHAVAMIPADRTRDALIPSFTVTENVALKGLGRRRGLMRWPAVRDRARVLVERFSISTAGVDAPVRTLSGGNQQRVVVARELEHQAPLLIADNPTSGLDLRATAFIHEQLRLAAAGGAAVLVHSSDLDEVLALATRVLVMYDGEVRAVAGGREAVGRAMLGAHE